jgi:hypothetical protein
VYLSQDTFPLFSAAKPMFVGQLLLQLLMLVRRQVSSRTQLAARRQLLLGNQLHSGRADGMIHGFLRSLGRGYAKPCRPRAAFSSRRKPNEDGQATKLSYPRLATDASGEAVRQLYSPECVEALRSRRAFAKVPPRKPGPKRWRGSCSFGPSLQQLSWLPDGVSWAEMCIGPISSLFTQVRGR